MFGGTIFKKQIADNGFGTGDNCLIIDSNYAYQAPFSFGDNWNKIKLGMFLSFTSGVEHNQGSLSEGYEDAGGISNDTFNWIGLVKNAQTKSLPLDVANLGFVGHKSNAIYLASSSSNNGNTLRIKNSSALFNGTGDGNALAVTSMGEITLSTGLIYDHEKNIPAVFKKYESSVASSPEASGFVNETGNGFCAYVGMTFEVHNKGTNDQRISMTMHGENTTDPLTANTADVSLHKLERYIDSLDTSGTQDSFTDSSNTNQNQITGLIFSNGSSAYDLPDSFFFYNALPIARPRIHAWAVKKLN